MELGHNGWCKMSSILYGELDYSMATGQGRRVKECDQCQGQGRSNAVQITRKEDGFLCHCFRCSKTYWFGDKGASPTQIQQRVKTDVKVKKDNRPEKVVLPDDYTELLPPKGLVQLYDMGITDDDISHFDIGWSQSHERIIVPVYKYFSGSDGSWATKLIGVAGRKLDDAPDDKPKWWSQRQRDIKHPRFIGMPTSIDHDKQVVIVEDVFSAIRISTTGRLSIALLTTYLPYELYPVLQGWDVRLWLDADAYNKSVKYQAALGANGISAQTILTMMDPKKYDNDDINRAIDKGGI
jgi:hypothetical protein